MVKLRQSVGVLSPVRYAAAVQPSELVRVVVLVGLALGGESLAAGGPDSTALSPEGALGAAVLAADDDGGAGWSNPASLGGLARSSVNVNVSAYSLAWVTAAGSLVTQTPWGDQSQHAATFRFLSVPAVIALTFKLRDGLGLGLGLFTTSRDSFSAGFDTSATGALPSAPTLTARLTQRFDWVESHDETWGAAALGWRPTPTLRLGVALQGAAASSERLIELDTALATGSTNPLERGAHLHVKHNVRANAVSARAVVGAQWQPTSFLRLGLAVRSPRLQLLGRQERVQLVLVSALLPGFAPQEGSGVDSAPRSSAVAVVEPVRLLGGAQVDVGRLSARLDGEWSPSMKLPDGALRASVRVRGGALFAFTPNLTGGLGLAWDRSRHFASQGALALDTISLSGGVTRRSADLLRALGGSEQLDLLTTVAATATWGFGEAPGLVIVPLALDQSVLPVLFNRTDQPFAQVPATRFEVALHLMTSLKF